MNYSMPAGGPPDHLLDNDSHLFTHDLNSTWGPDYSVANDRRSLSEASSSSHLPSSADSISSDIVTPGAAQSPSDDAGASAKPKRKRENRYKNAPPAVISRRRAQNRASQKAYRERKDQRIRDLEELLEEAHRKEETLSQAYRALQGEYDRLISEHQDPHYMTGSPTGLAADHGLISPSDPNPAFSNFEFLNGLPSNDMMAGLYLQHDYTTYLTVPPGTDRVE